jgi:hypothetical protein
MLGMVIRVAHTREMNTRLDHISVSSNKRSPAVQGWTSMLLYTGSNSARTVEHQDEIKYRLCALSNRRKTRRKLLGLY